MAINLNSGPTPGFTSTNQQSGAPEGGVAQTSPGSAALRAELSRARDVLKRYTGNEPDAIEHSEQWAAQSGLNIGLTDHEVGFIRSLSPEQNAALSAVTSEYTAAVVANSGSDPAGVELPDALNSRWSDYVNGVAAGGGQPSDVNALVQWVLRASYMETSKDLYFYAEKVKFYNNVKKAIREEIGRARDVMVDYAGMDETTALSPPFVGNPPVTDFTGGTDVSSTQDNAAATQAAAAMAAADAALQAETTGAGIHRLTDVAERNALVPQPGSGWDVFTTLDQNGEPLYRIDYKGSEVQIFEKSANGEWAQTTRVWGDPHVDEGGDGDSDWHFGNDSTFILPDGTKLFLDTKEVGDHVFVTSGITILSGTQRAHAGEGSETGVFNDRQQWDADNADMAGVDAGVFALAGNGEWAALGADGQFRDIRETASFTQFKQEGQVITEGGVITVSAAQAAAGRDAIGGALGNYNAALDDLGQFQEVSTTKAELDAYIQKMEEKLNSVGDDAQLANVDLQNMLQKQQQTMQMMSNISKMLHDTAMAIIRKIGG